MPLFTGALLALVCAGLNSAAAAFPGRNGLIAFTLFGPRTAQLATVGVDGTQLHKLTVGHDDRYPSFSADGKRIIMIRDGRITIVNADGSHPRQVNPSGICPAPAVAFACFLFTPRFSPDGGKVVFQRVARAKNSRGVLTGHGRGGIFVMNTDGSQIRRLTTTASDSDAEFSPNGRQIAFDRYLPTTKSTELFTMNPDGSHLHQLTHTTTRFSAEPDFSLDGSEIAFTRTFVFRLHICTPKRCINKHGPVDGIFVMNANGSNIRQLTTTSHMDSTPVFSPDGHSIAFVRQNDLFAMTADGSNQRPLTHVPASDNAQSPSWQPLR